MNKMVIRYNSCLINNSQVLLNSLKLLKSCSLKCYQNMVEYFQKAIQMSTHLTMSVATKQLEFGTDDI